MDTAPEYTNLGWTCVRQPTDWLRASNAGWLFWTKIFMSLLLKSHQSDLLLGLRTWMLSDLIPIDSRVNLKGQSGISPKTPAASADSSNLLPLV
jgi:hypothetical protein